MKILYKNSVKSLHSKNFLWKIHPQKFSSTRKIIPNDTHPKQKILHLKTSV